MKQLLTITLLIYSIFCNSQTKHDLIFETGIERKSLREELISNKLHKAALFKANITHSVISKANRYHSKFHYGYGFYNHLDFPNYDNRSIETYELGFELNVLRKLNLIQNKSYTLWAGLKGEYQYQNLDVLFLSNSFNKSNFQLNGGLNTSLKKEFSFFNQRFYTLFNFYIPLINYIGRPPYTLDSGEHLFANKKTLWIGEFLNISTQSSLIYKLKNKNKIALNYYWNYNSTDFVAPLKTASHIITIGFIFNLK